MINTTNNPAWLQWMTTLMGEALPAGRSQEGPSQAGLSEEGVSRHSYAATLPPDRFYCLLDEPPLHLVPQRVIKSLLLQEDRDQALYLNPQCIVCPATQLPDELALRPEIPAGFAMQGTIAWVRSPATGNLLPFWLGPQLEDLVRSLRPNEPAPSSVPDDARRLLAAAHILLSEERTSQGLREREEMIGKASPRFREKGYAPLAELIHPFHVAALRRYYRYLIRTGAIRL